MLIKNFFKDIISTLPRLLSVIIITGLGVFIFVSMNTVNTNLINTADTYFKEQHVADYWIYGDNLTKTDEKKVSAIEGVEKTQSQMVLEAEPLRNSEVTVILHGVSGDYELNTPLIIEGNFPKNKREIMLLEDHAKKHNIKVGDKYDLVVKNTNKKLSFVVCALVKSPEYISIATNTEPIQNSYKIGMAFMDEKALSEVVGENHYNQICVKLNSNANKDDFKREVKEKLGYKVSKFTALPDRTSTYIIYDTIHYITVLATVLPWIFFLISALIMFTTMSRIIESSRLQIGTLKALGYSDLTILMYFLSYSIIVIIVGVLIGSLPSMKLAVPLYKVYGGIIILPPHIITLDKMSVLSAFVLTTFFCVGTSFVICKNQLMETPSQCMRPKPPKTAKDIFLEKITFIWDKFNFTYKTIARNIFRNKIRMFMCIAGVCGCMGIVLASLGFMDANTNFIDKRYEKLYNFDLQVSMTRNTPEIEYKRLSEIDGVSDIEYQMESTFSVYKDSKKESSTIRIMEDEISLMLIDDDSPKTMTMPKNGILISGSIAKNLGVGIGDEIQYSIGTSSKKTTGYVSGISDSRDISFVGKGYWRSNSQPYFPTTAYIKTINPKVLTEKLLSYDFVVSVKGRDELILSIRNNFSVINVFCGVFILFGGMLALVVLYNLGIMNFYERMRELATLMVLGFKDKEIRTLILTENVIFTIIGIIIGIPVGIFLSYVLLGKSLRFGYTVDIFIKPQSFVFAALLTMLFSKMVNLMLGRKFKEIDMIGALKSVE